MVWNTAFAPSVRRSAGLKACATESDVPPVRLFTEPDPLRERQLGRPVDGVRLPAHVQLPAVAARLAAAAGFLLTTERTADLSAGGADVHVRDPAIRAAR